MPLLCCWQGMWSWCLSKLLDQVHSISHAVSFWLLFSSWKLLIFFLYLLIILSFYWKVVLYPPSSNLTCVKMNKLSFSTYNFFFLKQFTCLLFGFPSCGDGTLGVPPQRGDSHECRNMKLLLKQQQKVLVYNISSWNWWKFSIETSDK